MRMCRGRNGDKTVQCHAALSMGIGQVGSLEAEEQGTGAAGGFGDWGKCPGSTLRDPSNLRKHQRRKHSFDGAQCCIGLVVEIKRSRGRTTTLRCASATRSFSAVGPLGKKILTNQADLLPGATGHVTSRPKWQGYGSFCC